MSAPVMQESVMVCSACHNWQVDFPPRARELGGPHGQMWAAAELHVEHMADCVGAGGRIKVLDRWVERPELSDGKQADGVLIGMPLPRWWVWR